MSIISKCAIAKGDGTFSIETVQVESPKADEVLVKVKAAGLCHTDHDSLNWGKPIVMGHEGAGFVEQVGSAVTNLNVGDYVILNWATPCMTCFQCQEGNQHICESNSPVTAGGNGYTPGHAHLEGTTWNDTPIERSFNIGTLSEYTLVKASACVKIETNMPMPSASIISCGVMTGYGSVVNSAKLQAGSSAVVLGTGGVGLNVIQGARISGAAKIIAIDINQERLDMALQFGATHTILADKNDIGLLKASEDVKKLTNGRGADYAFECTAIPALGAAPLAMIRNAGTAVQVSGIEEEITIDMRLFEWDKIYINPLYGKCRPQVDFPKLVSLYEKGDLMLDEMITRTYPLENLQQAFDDMLTGKNAKGVIIF
ncbi:alcohol dehydrogenase [Formosa agariphila KMM 3901]|uniref:Alcohol dehydrogenase n=1 Tax=Formosa agariphila (strain DSM 15362 / KCTC 12365 / LMG 23005 / KMM 3901 / M-2Alg 35-1) TaxID=1347342 RepID=T2KM87_FORAG|nr:Zn-dependent alcohol dehydrogenase [Formosa agariphila]8H2A_A Chain A, Alcohol dehydrogenase [Formosa agariphila]8H2A_B Chain B, Alcohol dehydrogenase [Formosa agariphila]8H2A_C Chain C, Alcohol dehydrogenase [Formosa agariphila]8H2A_D Chain D, Alcohol dehydrogenase [Formosa agariphila]8H2A_E Chain E, Alcohol dehydrogenase [Formosa agariphila]8H2A_F Chain F, Alcohol dehydrogenase [Formosa agariphila]8H2A_G Chain G, Alcohol dehydrogenase [Formosa agariphila]8H2A_H Chain H, Alcohol dehydro